MTDGSHFSTAGGFGTSLAEAQRFGATAAQVWLQNNRSFRRKTPLTDENAAAGRALTDAVETVAHCSYVCAITNDEDDERTERALDGIREQLEVGARIGVRGLVLHPGRMRSEEDERNAVASLRALAPTIRRTVPLLLENASTGWHQELAVLADLIDAAGVDDVGICWDTAHSYGAGLDPADPVAAASEIAAARGLIRTVHFNNSIAELGSGRDRHSGLFDGLQSEAEVEQMYRNVVTALPDVPLLVEGAREEREVAAMRRWRSSLA